jgi:hypothetical protein
VLNGLFTTISGHSFANCISIFHKTEVQTIILRSLTGLNLNWLKSYVTKCKHFHFLFFCDFVKKKFAFCVITFEPIKIQTCSATQNDCLNLSFVKGNWRKNGQKWFKNDNWGGPVGAFTIDEDPRISSIE